MPDIHGILNGIVSDLLHVVHNVSFRKTGGIFLRTPSVGVFPFAMFFSLELVLLVNGGEYERGKHAIQFPKRADCSLGVIVILS